MSNENKTGIQRKSRFTMIRSFQEPMYNTMYRYWRKKKQAEGKFQAKGAQKRKDCWTTMDCNMHPHDFYGSCQDYLG
jgi:hypothetical protein